MAGRWEVVTLETPRGPITDRAGTFEWLTDAQITARGLQGEADDPTLISIACCEACQCATEGCEICNPELLVERPEGTEVDEHAAAPQPGELDEHAT